MAYPNGTDGYSFLLCRSTAFKPEKKLNILFSIFLKLYLILLLVEPSMKSRHSVGSCEMPRL